MKIIGLLSDTHGYIDAQVLKHFSKCDEIWHAGDIGSMEVLDTLRKYKPTRAVYGNIDGYPLRSELPEILRFKCEETDVLMKHIGGYPGMYDRSVYDEIRNHPPKLFISGHSHILKVMPDNKLKLLHINPGAAGKSGLHRIRTFVRFVVDQSTIRDLEVIEIER